MHLSGKILVGLTGGNRSLVRHRRRWKYIEIDPKCGVKAIPLQAWTGPKGSRRLRLPDFKTMLPDFKTIST
jgi:hypothetical protein